MRAAERFGHRQHAQLPWLAMRRHGTSAAVDPVSDGNQRTTRICGCAATYNATVSRAWVEVVGHHAGRSATTAFDVIVERHPGLLDQKLLSRFYRSSTLASDLARNGWVEPDLAPFPWQQAGRSSSQIELDRPCPPIRSARVADPRGGCRPPRRAVQWRVGLAVGEWSVQTEDDGVVEVFAADAEGVHRTSPARSQGVPATC